VSKSGLDRDGGDLTVRYTNKKGDQHSSSTMSS
jgi:hypothetical protein